MPGMLGAAQESTLNKNIITPIAGNNRIISSQENAQVNLTNSSTNVMLRWMLPLLMEGRNANSGQNYNDRPFWMTRHRSIWRIILTIWEPESQQCHSHLISKLYNGNITTWCRGGEDYPKVLLGFFFLAVLETVLDPRSFISWYSNRKTKYM